MSCNMNISLHRTAVVRAMILAHLGQEAGEMTRTELIAFVDTCEDPVVREMPADKRKVMVQNLVHSMAKAKQLTMRKKGRAAYYSSPGNQVPTKTERINLDTSSKHIPKPTEQANVQIGIDKTTGKIRLGVGGLVIEIGVIDE